MYYYSEMVLHEYRSEGLVFLLRNRRMIDALINTATSLWIARIVCVCRGWFGTFVGLNRYAYTRTIQSFEQHCKGRPSINSNCLLHNLLDVTLETGSLSMHWIGLYSLCFISKLTRRLHFMGLRNNLKWDTCVNAFNGTFHYLGTTLTADNPSGGESYPCVRVVNVGGTVQRRTFLRCPLRGPYLSITHSLQ